MRLKIKITKDVINRAKYCGTEKQPGFVTHNCAIAVAVRDIFDDAQAGIDCITAYGIRSGIFNFTEIKYWIENL